MFIFYFAFTLSKLYEIGINDSRKIFIAGKIFINEMPALKVIFGLEFFKLFTILSCTL